MERMLIIKLIGRRTGSFHAIRQQNLHTNTRLLNTKDSSSSSDTSDSDDKKPKQQVKGGPPVERDEESKKQTLDLLNSLLTKMSTDKLTTRTLDRAIPKKKPFPKKIPEPTLEEKLTGAAKEAAATLGGNVEKTQTDLLNKVFSAGTPTPEPMKMTKKEEHNASNLSLDDLLHGMKIERPSQKESITEGMPLSRSARVQELARRFQRPERNTRRSETRYTYTGKIESMDLHGGKRLMIFPEKYKPSENTQKLETWELLNQNELKLAQLHTPENIFQEMIQWTDKGLLWKFPIDNEIGMEKEENIHFSEHVFMERHLQGWCPKKGPIRHFMELVCVGLSKNPYMTVEEKTDHIIWYRDYFGEKHELLKEIGALGDIVDTKPQIDAK